MSTSNPSSEDLYTSLVPELRSLARRGVQRTYRKNAVLINEGEAGDSLFVLLQGSVKVFAMDESGREITYGTVHAGDYFGEMAMLSEKPAIADAIVSSDEARVIVIDAANIDAMLSDEPRVAMQLLKRMAARLQQSFS